MIALVDCNNFYASCERLFNPYLVGKPIVVLSNNDGCVIARSQEAKDLGINMGDPYHMAQELFKKMKVNVFSSNYTLYGDMSARVMSELSAFSPEIEIYSIDEAFLSLSGFQNLPKYAKEIRSTIIQNTGIPVSIGIGATKSLAKIANKLAKKHNGSLVLNTANEVRNALEQTKVGDVWGIGRQHEKRLLDMGITNAAQLSELSEEWALKNMTVVVLRLIKELKGYPCLDLELVRPKKKGICSSKSFGTPIESLSEMKEAVSSYVSNLGYKMRMERVAAPAITVFIETNPFNATDKQYVNSKTLQLAVPSNDTRELIKYASKGLELIYKPGHKYKKAGVICTNLVAEDYRQTNLFDVVDRSKNLKALRAYDLLNDVYGRGTIQFASEGLSKKWKVRANLLSPKYTTRWEDIIKAL